jgi:hypothetical protein
MQAADGWGPCGVVMVRLRLGGRGALDGRYRIRGLDQGSVNGHAGGG